MCSRLIQALRAVNCRRACPSGPTVLFALALALAAATAMVTAIAIAIAIAMAMAT
jgi:hypothetical protein